MKLPLMGCGPCEVSSHRTVRANWRVSAARVLTISCLLDLVPTAQLPLLPALHLLLHAAVPVRVWELPGPDLCAAPGGGE